MPISVFFGAGSPRLQVLDESVLYLNSPHGGKLLAATEATLSGDSDSDSLDKLDW